MQVNKLPRICLTDSYCMIIRSHIPVQLDYPTQWHVYYRLKAFTKKLYLPLHNKCLHVTTYVPKYEKLFL